LTLAASCLQENVQYDRARRTALVVDGQTKLAQMPATQFQNAYSHSINQIHKVQATIGAFMQAYKTLACCSGHPV
jgi:hypothetical protein